MTTPRRSGPGYLDPAEGRLLVATTVIDEPTFFRTVVLLLEHDDAVGTLGVVLNRPTDLPVGDAVPGWQDEVCAPGVLFTGGPVAEGSALALATRRPDLDEVPGLTGLFADLAMVDLAVEAARLRPSIRDLRIYSGYAGWGPGQLRGELRSGAWWVFESVPADWFNSTPDRLWPEVLRRQGGRWRLWANAPDDPESN
jgi:putative transcriptional regulator